MLDRARRDGVDELEDNSAARDDWVVEAGDFTLLTGRPPLRSTDTTRTSLLTLHSSSASTQTTSDDVHPTRHMRRVPLNTRSSAIAEGPRDAPCQLKPC